MADEMIASLYRIRPPRRAAGELESQTIFFARPDSLNDPTEGLRDIFWLGDQIVWRNLFKHYLICLNAAWNILAAKGESSPMSWDEIPIAQILGRDAQPLKKFHDEIFAEFFAEQSVTDCTSALVARQTPIRRNEMAAHMRTLHFVALTTGKT